MKTFLTSLREIHSGSGGLSHVRVIASVVVVTILGVYVGKNVTGPKDTILSLPWSEAALIAGVIGIKVAQKFGESKVDYPPKPDGES